MGQEIARRVGDVYGHLFAGHAHVHMQPEDQVTPGGFLHLVHDLPVPVMVRDELALPVGKGVGARSAHA